ncbi:MAG: hypothetical protein HY663_04080 [Chloroflexi bacterium]|nr:hypothetical protein [Chloroflexota bacterium]
MTTNKENRNECVLSKSAETLWRHRYEAFVRLFKGRDDVIAEWQGTKYVPVPGAGLTFERFFDHVQLKKRYAIYNRDDAGRVSFGLFDVDVLPRHQGWEHLLLSMDEKRKETALIMQTLCGMGLDRRNMLVEFPTVGFHLFLFFGEPVPAKALKALMAFVLKSSALEQIPFYPREVEETPWGDAVQLPLRVNQLTSRRSNFVRDLQFFEPESYAQEPDFSVLKRIELIDSEWVQGVMSKYHLL